MKKILTIITGFFIPFAAFAAEEVKVPPVAPIQEIKNKSLDFDNLPKKSVIGALANYVTSEKSLLDGVAKRIHWDSLLYPNSEGLAYINGFLCHVGNYPRSIVYTFLEGPQYGLQTVLDYYGNVLYVNYDYSIEYAPYGVIFHHFYSDSEIITGSTQVISFD